MKYRITIEANITRTLQKTITVTAPNEQAARDKALDKANKDETWDNAEEDIDSSDVEYAIDLVERVRAKRRKK